MPRVYDLMSKPVGSASHLTVSLNKHLCTRYCIATGTGATVAAPVEDDAAKTGLWSKTLTVDQPQKVMGGYRLPVNVPETNVPSAVLDDMASRQEGPDGSPALQMTQKPAARKGLEIKVRTSWDGELVCCGCYALYKGF